MKINICISLIILVLVVSCKPKNNNIVKEYYPDGTIKSEITMKNNMRNGITKNYDEKGRLISTAEYIDDKHEGWLINYNPKNGKIASKAMFRSDEQDGPVYMYYQGGNLFRESTYVKGRVDGIIKTYWPDGKIKAENNYKMGKPSIGLKEYDKTGKLLDQPKIVFKESIKINRILVQVSLSDGNQDVDFYVDDELEEGKYFNPKSYKLRNDEGISSLEIPMKRMASANNKVKIIARVKTKFSNTLILEGTHVLGTGN